MYRMLLHIFPLIQMISFISGLLLLDSHIYLAIILFFFAALFLNFSLHITIHHFVHFRYKSNLLNLLIESVYSIFWRFLLVFIECNISITTVMITVSEISHLHGKRRMKRLWLDHFLIIPSFGF